MSITHALAVFPSKDEFEIMKRYAGMLAESEMIPEHFKSQPASVFAIIQRGKELGIPPMYALNNISVIKGKASANSELMLALIYRDHGDKAITFLETDAEKCVIEYRRRGGKKGKLAYTVDDANVAGHFTGRNGETWRKYPANMLRARCISAVARMVFPDSIGGMYTPEELDEPVDEEGNVMQAHSDAHAPHDIVEVIPARSVPITVDAETGEVIAERIEGEVVYHVPDEAPVDVPANPPLDVHADDDQPINPARSRAVWATARKHGWDEEKMRTHLRRNHPDAINEKGESSTRGLTMGEAHALIEHIKALDAMLVYATKAGWTVDELEQYAITAFPELVDEQNSPLLLMNSFEQAALAAKIVL